MRKFTVNILVFSIAIFSIFSLISFIVDQGLRKSEYGNFKEWNEIFDGKISSDILIQGSSRAWVQYNTFILDSILNRNSYNMGMDGSPFDVQYIRYKACIKNNVPPKLILQNVDWDTMTKNTPVYQKYQFMPYLTDPDFEKQVLEEELLSKAEVFIPFLKYSGQTKAIQIGLSEFLGIKHFVSQKHKGYAGAELAWDGTNFEKRKKQGKISWVINPAVEKLFVEFLSDCRKRDIKVVLVFSPAYHEISDMIVNRKGLLAYYQNMARTYNAGFIDFSTDSLSLDKTNFYNATHLNKRGSELFTRKLANQLKTMNLLTTFNR